MSGETKVVETVSGWLTIFSDGTVDRTWTGPADKKVLSDRVPPSNDTFVNGVATRDVVVDPETGVWVRVYLPESAVQTPDQKLGVAIHFKGGGFCVSHPDWRMYYEFYARLVKNANVICVSVDYRLAPEHRLPTACEDCFGAVAWLASVARGEKDEPWLTRHGDFSRCVMIGDSAGGNLVHQISARVRSCEEIVRPVRVRGAVLLEPDYVITHKFISKSEDVHDSALLSLRMMDKFLHLALPVSNEGGKDHHDPITNPMGPHAPPLEKLSFPPVMVGIAGKDLERETQMEYCRAMKAAGHDVEVLVSENVGHAFYLNHVAIESDPNIKAETIKLLEGLRGFIERCCNEKSVET